MLMNKVLTTKSAISDAHKFQTSPDYPVMKTVSLALSTTWHLRSSSTTKAKKQEPQQTFGHLVSFYTR